MSFNAKIIPHPANYHYNTPFGAGPVPTYENAKSVFTGKQLLVNLYAFNSSGAAIYLAVVDTPDGTIASCTRLAMYPIPSLSFVGIATPGGDRIEGGLYLKAFTDTGLVTPAGSVMTYKVDYDPYISFLA
jgi:hypothetical protein